MTPHWLELTISITGSLIAAALPKYGARALANLRAVASAGETKLLTWLLLREHNRRKGENQ